MKILIMIFILVATILILLGHVGLFFSWIKFFSITSHSIKLSLGIILGILSFSFLITSLLVMWKDSVVIHAAYTFASSWLGFIWYAALAALGTWITIGIARLTSSNAPLPVFATLFLGIALLVTIYGLWNAQHPVVRHVQVAIDGLPVAWQGKTIVQLSDIHLGPVHTEKFLQKVVTDSNAIHPYAVFITGDLFDGEGTNLKNRAQPLSRMESTVGTFFITGNHETYVDVEKSLNAISQLPIRILRDEVVMVQGMQIVGIDYPLPGKKKDISAILGKTQKNIPTIALFHEPSQIAAFEEAGVSLLLSGHTHKGQLWPFGAITHKVFKGFDYGLKMAGNMLVYTSPGVGTWGPPLRTGNQPEIVAITLQKK